jgi:hypothetical protein
VDRQEVIASDAELSGSTLTLALPSPVNEDQEVSVAFDHIFAAERIAIFVDGAGNAMDSFRWQPVANRSTVLVANEPVTTSVLLSRTLLELEEGDSATYTVALSSQPSADVMVNITRFPDAPLAMPFLTMTFTPENWNVPQEVTIEAESDDDDHSHLAFLNHTAIGGGYHLETAEMRVVIRDNNG